jgi:hypothetical protein
MASFVDYAAVAADETIYTCNVCGGEFQAVEMSKAWKAQFERIYVGRRCLRCTALYKRKRERRLAAAPRGEDGTTIIEALLESDPAPARLLVDLLRDDRDRSHFDFAVAWAEDVAFVLARIPNVGERELWREAFESLRSAWQAAWSNAPGPGWRLSPALADEPSSERVPALLVVA